MDGSGIVQMAEKTNGINKLRLIRFRFVSVKLALDIRRWGEAKRASSYRSQPCVLEAGISLVI